MKQCGICYDEFSFVTHCIYCKICICIECLNYASKNKLCSKANGMMSGKWYYCSMSCIFKNHHEHHECFIGFIHRINKKSTPEFYDEFYIHSQKIAYT